MIDPILMGNSVLATYTKDGTTYKVCQLVGYSILEALDISNNHILTNMSREVARRFAEGIILKSKAGYPIHDIKNLYSVNLTNDLGMDYTLLFGATLYNSVESNATLGLLFEDVIPEINLDITTDQLTNSLEFLSTNIPHHVSVTVVGCLQSDLAACEGNSKLVTSESCVIEMTALGKSPALCLDTYLLQNLNKKRRYDVKKSFEAAANLDIGICQVVPNQLFWSTAYTILENNFGEGGRGLDNDYSYDVALYQWASVEGLYSMLYDSVDGNEEAYQNLINSDLVKQVPVYAAFRQIEDVSQLVGAIALVRRPDGSYIFHSLFMDSALASDGMGKAMLLMGSSMAASSESETQTLVSIDTGSALAPWEESEDHYGIYKRKCSSTTAPKVSGIASHLPRRYSPYYDVTNKTWVTENE